MHSVLSDEYFRCSSGVESRGLSEIDQAKIDPHPLARYDLYVYWIDDVVVPYVGTLIDLKLLRSVTNRLTSKAVRSQHGIKLESVDYKNEDADGDCRNFNSKSGIALHEFYKAHRFLLAFASILGNLWCSGQFVIYCGGYGRFRLGKCIFSLLLAFVFAAHTIALIVLF